MFHVKILDVRKVVYDGETSGVYFNIENIGQHGILTNHMNDNFKIVPSCLYVFTEKNRYKFFIGYGYAKMLNNNLEITGAPIAKSFDNFKEKSEKLYDYGQDCLRNFVSINL